MMCRTSVLLALFLAISCLPIVSHAQDNRYSLEKSIEEALEKNWSLKAKSEKVNQALDVKNQARAEFLPKLSTSYGYTRLSEETIMRPSIPGLGTFALSSQDNYQWRGTVTQPLFTGLALVSSYQLAKLGIDQSRMELELEKLDLALRVKEAYFNILIADKAVEVAEKEVESLGSNVNLSSNFYNVGVIPVNDLLKAEVELASAQQALVKARNAARLARASFNTVLARPVSEAAEVEDILVFKPEQVNFEDRLAQALESRPEMKITDINILKTDQQARLSRSRNYPEISFQYDYIKEGDDPDVSGSLFHDEGRWQAMAVFSWTFWEWGKTYYSVQENESQKKELAQLRLALEDNICLELQQAVLALETAEKNIPTTMKAVEQGEENMRVNEERYKAQVTTITEVLDAQTLLTQARVNYYKALYLHNLAKARLLRTVGTY
ncbi:putative Type I secretion outer membrane protein [uncultured Desulfobacterium sp.]|uniref:Putative Type I secretion outer membrane protein n=1 Tax=uncultured Desulfobacterium sp. TaxID=201089 RepID=A0A445N007_9BACT|nr:putative Type I secretion outer membrane protein [uncultured Desulfobacterium sp.]